MTDKPEIDITEKMVNAGIRALMTFDPDDHFSETVVREVYEAMELVRRAEIAAIFDPHN